MPTEESSSIQECVIALSSIEHHVNDASLPVVPHSHVSVLYGQARGQRRTHLSGIQKLALDRTGADDLVHQGIHTDPLQLGVVEPGHAGQQQLMPAPEVRMKVDEPLSIPPKLGPFSELM